MRPFQKRVTYKDGYERGLAEGRAGAAMLAKEGAAELVESGICVCYYLSIIQEENDDNPSD
jgi:hypothetical protein